MCRGRGSSLSLHPGLQGEEGAGRSHVCQGGEGCVLVLQGCGLSPESEGLWCPGGDGEDAR